MANQTRSSNKFTDAQGNTLTVYMREGKTGINIGVSLKTNEDGKAVTGCQSSHNGADPIATATLEFDRLSNEALSQGWHLAQSPQSFDQIPVAAKAKAKATSKAA